MAQEAPEVGMSVDVLTRDPKSAHEAVTEAWRVSKALTQAGKTVHIVAKEDEDDRSLEANRYYWGVFLPQVSAQARIEGQRYTVDAWHELGKRTFLGFEVKKVRVAGRKKATIIRRLRSTTDLSVRQFAKYQEEFAAFAATELGVVFEESP